MREIEREKKNIFVQRAANEIARKRIRERVREKRMGHVNRRECGRD